jgi:hypothetical protein
MKEKHKNFIRISWNEAFEALEKSLQEKYGAKGKIQLKQDYGYDGIGDFYDEPKFVDIYLEVSNPTEVADTEK